MKIGVIGVGAIGGTIAKKLANAGHDLKVANSRGKVLLKNLQMKLVQNHLIWMKFHRMLMY